MFGVSCLIRVQLSMNLLVFMTTMFADENSIDTLGLLQSVDLAVKMVKNGDLGVPVPDYTDTNVSDKVVRIIQSYVGVVNKMVWRKESE